MATAILTVSRVRHLFDYNPTTGHLRRLVATSSTAMLGEIAGSPQSGGYRSVYVDGKLYKEHRIIWLHVYGEWPKNQIDHRNGKRDDNRIWNLRDVTAAENSENRRLAGRGKKSECRLGVTPLGSNFQSEIRVAGKRYKLGVFPTEADAYATYLEAKRLLHKGCVI